jgi:nucleotidyltransferase substrate binding protein (TIGR01987 family)
MKKYENFCSNLASLERADQEELENEFIISGIIDKFSLQFELTWKLLKELLSFEGRNAARTGSPREIIKESYAVYDFIDEQTYLAMLHDRNDMTHLYDGKAARELVTEILRAYIPAFRDLKRNLEDKYGFRLQQF